MLEDLVQEGGKLESGYRPVCNKCKNAKHTTKECKLGHCVICGKISHFTDDCAWLKQMKFIPKYVGCAARGMGVLLLQNSK